MVDSCKVFACVDDGYVVATVVLVGCRYVWATVLVDCCSMASSWISASGSAPSSVGRLGGNVSFMAESKG